MKSWLNYRPLDAILYITFSQESCALMLIVTIKVKLDIGNGNCIYSYVRKVQVLALQVLVQKLQVRNP